MFPIQRHIDLTPYNTFGLKAYANYYGELVSKQQLAEICRLPEFDLNNVLWLGGGSNVLFRQDYSGLVIRILTKGIKILQENEQQALIEAQAGEIWHDFVQQTIKLGFSGLENLSLIPGTVGAAPVQNIGAYGVEVKERIESIECFDLTNQQWLTLNNTDCQFAYRDSLFKQQGKGRYVITAVRFWLDKHFTPNLQYGDLAHTVTQNIGNQKPTAQDVAKAVCQIRHQKLPDPKMTGNVGSFYKNPIISAQQAQTLLATYPNMPHYPQANGDIKLAAGWLIDQCGLKGKQIGNVMVHPNQALVLINRGQATSEDVEQLSDSICQTVQQKFNIHLETEPNWLPER